ncbi:hypothetical protein LSAT2_017760, partial [Lamellibrachia satsuma]
MNAPLYQDNMYCQWKINVEQGKRMFLHFNRFDVQDSSACSNDSVSLKDTATGIVLFTFCGNKSPSDVMSLSNEMTVVFASDSSMTKNGFVISYMLSRKVF